MLCGPAHSVSHTVTRCMRALVRSCTGTIACRNTNTDACHDARSQAAMRTAEQRRTRRFINTYDGGYRKVEARLENHAELAEALYHLRWQRARAYTCCESQHTQPQRVGRRAAPGAIAPARECNSRCQEKPHTQTCKASARARRCVCTHSCEQSTRRTHVGHLLGDNDDAHMPPGAVAVRVVLRRRCVEAARRRGDPHQRPAPPRPANSERSTLRPDRRGACGHIPCPCCPQPRQHRLSARHAPAFR